MMDVGEKIWRLLISCPGTHWRGVTDALEVACAAAQQAVAPFVHELTLLVGRALLARKVVVSEECDEFFQLVYGLCFLNQNCRTKALEREFKISTFARYGKIEPAPTILVQKTGGIARSISLKSGLSSALVVVEGEPEREIAPVVGKSTSVASMKPKKRMTSLAELAAINEVTPPVLEVSSTWLDAAAAKLGRVRRGRVFLLRLDNNGAWLDKDGALLALQLFERSPNPLALPVDLLLCRFLLRDSAQRDCVEQHLSRVTLSGSQLSACSRLLHLVKCAMNRCGHVTRVPFLAEFGSPAAAFDSLCQIAAEPNGVHESLLFGATDSYNKIAVVRSAKLSEVLQYRASTFVSAVRTEAVSFAKRQQARRQQGLRDCERLWQSLTAELGPWEGAAEKASTQSVFRSRRLCGSGYPVGVRRKLSHEPRPPRAPLSPTSLLGRYSCVVVSAL
jgi:hypothetical protein